MTDLAIGIDLGASAAPAAPPRALPRARCTSSPRQQPCACPPACREGVLETGERGREREPPRLAAGVATFADPPVQERRTLAWASGSPTAWRSSPTTRATAPRPAVRGGGPSGCFRNKPHRRSLSLPLPRFSPDVAFSDTDRFVGDAAKNQIVRPRGGPPHPRPGPLPPRSAPPSADPPALRRP